MAELERTTEVSLREVTDRLRLLPERLRRNIMRGALRAAGKKVADIARGLITSRTGQLRSTIRVAVSNRVRDDVMSAKIKAGESGKEKDAVYWAHFVERGTAPHLITAANRPMRVTRHGPRVMSIKTVNKMVRSGSLKIGGNFVGPMVQHPGTSAQRFMERAAAQASGDTVKTMAEYISKRLEKEAKR